jgi:hypothetical protein
MPFNEISPLPVQYVFAYNTMGNIQAPGHRISFVSDMVAGEAIFVPADTPADQLRGQQYTVETGYEGIENYRLWTSRNRPPPMIRQLPQLGDYELMAAVKMVTPLTDDQNRVVVDIVVGNMAFAFTANEIGRDVPRVGDAISCTVRALSLWDEAI